MSPENIIEDNIEALNSGAAILDHLTYTQYNHIPEPYFTASIGKHFRHILDHYLSFLKGLSAQHIYYDRRDRDIRIETDCKYAIDTLREIVDRLFKLKSEMNAPDSRSRLLEVSLCTSVTDSNSAPVTTSIERELIFLHGHTTHHFAIIAGMLKLSKLPVSSEFGVAPSTLIYEEQSQCAP